MLDCPLQTQTSPNMKSLKVSVVVGVAIRMVLALLAPPSLSVAVAVRLCSSKLGCVAGRSARHVVILPVAWSGPIVAVMVLLLNWTVTLVVVLEQKPQTIACFGAA